MPSRSRSVGKTKLIQDFNFPVPSSQTEDYVISTLTKFKSVKLHIDIEDTSDKRRIFLVIGSNKDSSDNVSDQIYSKIGDIIDYECNVLISGSDVVLRIVNNDSNLIQVNGIQIKNS